MKKSGLRRNKFERGTRSHKRDNYSINYEREQADISKLRRETGIAQIRQGDRECLSCSKIFFSEDLCRNRLCYNCNEANEGRSNG